MWSFTPGLTWVNKGYLTTKVSELTTKRSQSPLARSLFRVPHQDLSLFVFLPRLGSSPYTDWHVPLTFIIQDLAGGLEVSDILFRILATPRLEIFLYKTIFYFRVVCARINRPFIPQAHLHCPHCCNTIARLLGNIRPPLDLPCVCDTPYNIGNNNIV